jgi:antitoxin component of RelBE/YafQ-DinJ toxin-antitoxin module
MKSHLNLTIDDNLLKKMKVYAENLRVSLSELVESYFKEVIQTTEK